jgi:hypothetical protein
VIEKPFSVAELSCGVITDNTLGSFIGTVERLSMSTDLAVTI